MSVMPAWRIPRPPGPNTIQNQQGTLKYIMNIPLVKNVCCNRNKSRPQRLLPGNLLMLRAAPVVYFPLNP